jgi:hypothetical protein
MSRLFQVERSDCAAIIERLMAFELPGGTQVGTAQQEIEKMLDQVDLMCSVYPTWARVARNNPAVTSALFQNRYESLVSWMKVQDMLAFSKAKIYKSIEITANTPFEGPLVDTGITKYTESILKVLGIKKEEHLRSITSIYLTLENAHKILFLFGREYRVMRIPIDFPDMEVLAWFPLRVLENITRVQREFVTLALESNTLLVDEILPSLKETTAFGNLLSEHYSGIVGITDQLKTSILYSLDTYTIFMIYVSKNPPDTLLFTEMELIRNEWRTMKLFTQHISGSYEKYVVFFIQFALNFLSTVRHSQHLKPGPLSGSNTKAYSMHL